MVDGVDVITPVNLKGRVGRFYIVVKKEKRGEEISLVNMRNAIYSGLRPRTIIVENHSFVIHKLMADVKPTKGLKFPNQGLITSDCPNEIFTQWKALENVHGNVLVGGLGLGMASIIIANSISGVTGVTTIENEKDIISLIKPQLPETAVPHKIVRADLFRYIVSSAKRGLKFDSAYFDIWSPTGEGAWMEYIVPLRRLMAKHHPGADVYNWLETDMTGQIRLSLQMVAFGRMALIGGGEVSKADRKKIGVTDAGVEGWIRSFQPYDVFRKGLQGTKNKRKIQILMEIFLKRVGTPEWENVFGKYWDTWKRPTEKEVQAIYA